MIYYHRINKSNFLTLKLVSLIVSIFILTSCPDKKESLLPGELEVSSLEVDFKNQITANFKIKNNGQEDLSYTILNSDKLDWVLNIDPATGTIRGASEQEIMIQLDSNKLEPGSNSGQLKISAISQGGNVDTKSTSLFNLNVNIRNEAQVQILTLKAFRVELPKASQMETNHITTITTITAQATATIERIGSSPIIQLGHVWDTLSTPTLKSNVGLTKLGALIQPDKTTSKLENLKPSTKYYIRIYATNSGGTIYSNIVTFKTLAFDIDPENQAPTDITLSKASIIENNAINANIGTFSTSDADDGDNHIYFIVGNANRDKFNLNKDTLRASQSLDYETRMAYTIRIRTDDGRGGRFEKDFTITVGNSNDPPTELTLSDSVIAENNAVNAVIGDLTITDEDKSDTYTYTLVSGSSDFNISGNSLRASKVFDYETKNTYPIRIKITDGGGNSLEKDFTITIQNVPDRAFITKWRISSSGEALPIRITGTGYNYTIDWGDGTIESDNTVEPFHTYASPGTYTIRIVGHFPRIFINDDDRSKDKLISVEQWGDIAWTSMGNAFQGCSNLTIQATDSPDLSKVTDMSRMFQGCTSLNQNINHWDVSNVTNMRALFAGATAFNQELNGWNVSNVTNMRSVFYEATSFNQDLNNWDVSNVTSMLVMFDGASAFNGNISTWKTPNVTNMEQMFNGATSFNQDLNNWDVSNVTNMRRMFREASAFNQNLNSWDVSNVTNMSFMFSRASAFNGDISTWKTPNVTDMSDMFSYASAFNQNLNDWNVSKVTDMRWMFQRAIAFNQPLKDWKVSKVTNMSNMFEQASTFNQNLNDWDVSNVTSMSWMFQGAIAFNQPLKDWKVGKVTDMSDMFDRASAFNQDISNWDVSNVTNMFDMFHKASAFNQDISSWKIAKVTDMTDILKETSFSAVNYDALLTQWASRASQSNVEFHAGSAKYTGAGEAGRNTLIGRGWTITDGGKK